MAAIIKVTGRGTISVRPDTVRLLIMQEHTEESYNTAVRKAAEMAGALADALIPLGFSREDIKTLSFKVNSDFEYYQDGSNCRKRRFLGYKYSQRLKLEFPTDNTLLGKVLSRFAKLPAAPEFRIEYTVKDLEAAKNALLAKAVADSRAKAEALCAAAGETLGGIVSIDYSREEIDFISSSKLCTPYGADFCCDYDDDDDFSVDIEPDDIRQSDTVTIVWNLA